MTSPPDESPARVADTTASVTSSGSDAPAPPRRRRTATADSTAGAPPPTVAPPAPVAPLEGDGGSAAPAKPSRRARRPAAPAGPSTSAITEAVFGDEEPARQPRRRDRAAMTRPSSAPRGDRRFRQTLVKVDLWSVTKLALCFYLSAMFVTIVAMIALWLIADAAGIIHSVEKFLGDLLSAKNFQFLSGEVLRGTILIGLVIVALQVVITVIAASFYNIFAELFGGLEIVVKEEGEVSR